MTILLKKKNTLSFIPGNRIQLESIEGFLKIRHVNTVSRNEKIEIRLIESLKNTLF